MGLLLVLVGWFYIWTARVEDVSWNFGRKQTDYYNLLLDGFLDGHLYMKVDVPPELLRLADPYNPKNRPPGVGLHDASMYRGHYYLYFGAAPVVTLFLPFRLLTGTDLPLPAAVVTFCFIGFLASAATWRAIRRRYFLEAGLGLELLCLLALATTSLTPVLLRRSSIWELSLSAGYAFAMLALYCVYRCLHAERRATWWLAGGSLALGLAVASRPSYIYACVLLALPPLWQWWRGPRRGIWPETAWLWRTAAGLTPLVAVGLAMAWYNYARFGHPLEFGVAYQFSGIYEAETRHFRWGYFPYNAYLYFLTPAAWSPYFPFIHLTAQPPIPAGHLGSENVFGVLPNLPLAWCVLLAPLALWRRSAEERARLWLWLAAAGLLVLSTAATLTFFYAAMARYQIDFAAALMLLACVGVLAGERVAKAARSLWPWRIAAVVGRGLLLASTFFAVLYGCELYGLFRRQNPKNYRQVATALNQPSQWWQRLAGTAQGAVELDVCFPTERAPGREPLVTTGWLGASDRVFVQYNADGRVQLGYAHDGGDEQLSRPVRVTRGVVQHLRVELGSLYPPEAHPFFDGWAPAEVARCTRRLRVRLDDEVLLDKHQRFYDGAPGAIFVGHDPHTERYGRRFSGEIARVARPGDWAALRSLAAQSIQLRLLFPAAGGDAKQPLLATTRGGRAGGWFVQAVGPRQARFSYAEAGGGVWESEPVEIDFATVHEVEFAAWAGWIEVMLDGVILGSPRLAEIDLSSPAVAVGKRPAAMTEGAAEFGGTIYSIGFARGVVQPTAAETFDTVRLKLVFPRQRVGAREPLVVTGETGRGDFLLVEYLDAGRVRFALDHWGRAAIWSEPVAVDFSATHEIEIGLGSFPPSGGAMRKERLLVRLDGQTVLDRPAKFYPTEPEDVYFGRNPIGGSSCQRFFTGALLEVKKLRAAR